MVDGGCVENTAHVVCVVRRSNVVRRRRGDKVDGVSVRGRSSMFSEVGDVARVS